VVPVQVVADGVVVGDHLAVGQAGRLPFHLGVQGPQGLEVGGQVGLVEAGRAGVDPGQAALDVGRHHHGVAGVLPDVGVGLAADLAQPHPLAGVDHRAVVAGALDGVVQPRLQADAVLDHQLGGGDGLDVGRGRLVVVGADPRLEQADQVDPVGPDDGRHVGHLGGGGHHPRPVRVGAPGACRLRAAGHQQEGRHHGGQRDPPTTHGTVPTCGSWCPPSYRFWQ